MIIVSFLEWHYPLLRNKLFPQNTLDVCLISFNRELKAVLPRGVYSDTSPPPPGPIRTVT